MRFSCLALPDDTAGTKIQALMNLYSHKSGSRKALAYLPHFSVWGDFEINDNAATSLYKRLDSLASNMLPLDVHLSRYGFYPWHIVYLDIDKTDALQKLHQAVMDIVQEYRTPWVSQTLLESTHFHGAQQDYIERFGYQFAGEFYSPHFTLAGNDMSESAFEEMKALLSQKQEDIRVGVEHIALIERESGANQIAWMSAAKGVEA